MTSNTDALVLKYYLYREHDRLYTLYTRDFGKIHVIAKGANKIRSKLAGHLEPFVLSRIMVAARKNREQQRFPDILAQARTITSFSDLRFNHSQPSYGFVIIEALDRLTREKSDDQRIFNLALAAMERCGEATHDGVLFDIIYRYLLHFLIYSGFAPDTNHLVFLQPILVAGLDGDDIIVTNEARRIIEQYLTHTMGDEKLLSFEQVKSACNG